MADEKTPAAPPAAPPGSLAPELVAPPTPAKALATARAKRMEALGKSDPKGPASSGGGASTSPTGTTPAASTPTGTSGLPPGNATSEGAQAAPGATAAGAGETVPELLASVRADREESKHRKAAREATEERDRVKAEMETLKKRVETVAHLEGATDAVDLLKRAIAKGHKLTGEQLVAISDLLAEPATPEAKARADAERARAETTAAAEAAARKVLKDKDDEATKQAEDAKKTQDEQRTAARERYTGEVAQVYRAKPESFQAIGAIGASPDLIAAAFTDQFHEQGRAITPEECVRGLNTMVAKVGITRASKDAWVGHFAGQHGRLPTDGEFYEALKKAYNTAPHAAAVGPPPTAGITPEARSDPGHPPPEPAKNLDESRNRRRERLDREYQERQAVKR